MNRPLMLPDVIADMAKTDPWAMNELMRYHRRMIRMVAGKFTAIAQSMTKEDLEQEVSMAMIQLLPTWKPTGGASFSTYCFKYLPYKVARAMRYSDLPVKLPPKAAIAMYKDYEKTGKSNRPISVSMYKPGNFEDGTAEEALLDEVESQSAPVDFESRELVRICGKFIERLHPRQKEVFLRVVLGDESIVDAAKALGVTRQCAHSMYHRATKRLRQMANDRGLLTA